MTETVDAEGEGYVIGSRLVTFTGGELAGRTQERWWVKDPTGREVMSGIATKADAERHRAEIAANAATVAVEFADGRIVAMRADTARWTVGLDADGDVVIEHPDMPGYPYPVTPCCHASGKGSVNSDTGVICRACYAEVGYKYGMDGVAVVPVKKR